ncbi:MAG: hypothetical protein IKE24_00615, partial [Clostridia bacterium]|nr:hypothetical protein [Clostridia bacterium]
LETAKMLKGLCVYTIQICKNEKNFPKRDRWILTAPIVKCAVKAYAKVLEANAITVVKLDDYMMRRKCQIQARKKLKAMLGLIEIAYTTLSLEDDRLEYWTGYVKNCLELLSKWRAADRKRYAKQLNGEITRKGEKPGNPL